MIEREMEYRGSKSAICNAVKEQRVDGQKCVNLMRIRYALMGFERNYQNRIPSNYLITLRRSYTSLSTKSLCNFKLLASYNLNPRFLTGFSDVNLILQ